MIKYFVITIAATLLGLTIVDDCYAAERKASRDTPYSNRSVREQREFREIARRVDRDREQRNDRREYEYQRKARERGN